MSDEERRDRVTLGSTYGTVRLWALGLLGPGLVVTEVVQRRYSLGLGLGFLCAAAWCEIVQQVKDESPSAARWANILAAIGGAFLAWYCVRWWIGSAS
jgi:hypothetical protein